MGHMAAGGIATPAVVAADRGMLTGSTQSHQTSFYLKVSFFSFLTEKARPLEFVFS